MSIEFFYVFKVKSTKYYRSVYSRATYVQVKLESIVHDIYKIYIWDSDGFWDVFRA